MGEKKLIELTLEVGNDNGNSEHDMVINGVVIQQPNCLAKVRKLPLLDEINSDFVAKNIHNNLLITIASTSAEPGIYYIGSYALRSGERVRNIEVGVDNNKLDSDIVVINTLAQIAGFAVKQAHLQGDNLMDVELLAKVDMTTALPVTQYSRNSANTFADKFLKDKHTLIVHVGSINISVDILFEYVKVLPESVPATFELQHMTLIEKENLTDADYHHNSAVKSLFHSFINNDSQIDGSYFKGKRILHVSIGEGTTEYPLTDDIEFNPNFIDGSNNGVGHAIDKALSEFKHKTNLQTYSRQKYSELLKDQSHKYSNLAYDEVSGYLEEESEEIIHNVKREIQRANNEIDIVTVYGGGSILMNEYLQPKMIEVCKKANIELFYVPEEFAVTLEAKGMYEFVTSKIYKILKGKYISRKESA